MGSSISIYNDTEVVLNIALSQVGPLYYKNFVLPGECVTFDVGKVWFTIDGRVWNGDNEYDGIQVARPIIEFTLEAVTLFMITFAFGKGLNALTFGRVGEKFAQATKNEKFAQATKEVKDVHKNETTNKLLLRIFNGNAINSPGWYLGNDRLVSISGGPKYVRVDDEDKVLFHKIDVNTLNNPFSIKDK